MSDYYKISIQKLTLNYRYFPIFNWFFFRSKVCTRKDFHLKIKWRGLRILFRITDCFFCQLLIKEHHFVFSCIIWFHGSIKNKNLLKSEKLRRKTTKFRKYIYRKYIYRNKKKKGIFRKPGDFYDLMVIGPDYSYTSFGIIRYWTYLKILINTKDDLAAGTGASNLVFNEKIKALREKGETIHHLGFGQCPFPLPKLAVQVRKHFF